MVLSAEASADAGYISCSCSIFSILASEKGLHAPPDHQAPLATNSQQKHHNNQPVGRIENINNTSAVPAVEAAATADLDSHPCCIFYFSPFRSANTPPTPIFPLGSQSAVEKKIQPFAICSIGEIGQHTTNFILLPLQQVCSGKKDTTINHHYFDK